MTWYLLDLTTPIQPKTNEEPADNCQGRRRWRNFLPTLTRSCISPRGMIFWRTADGKRSGEQRTEAKRVLSEWLTYIGIGAAVIGLALATGGASALPR